MGRPQEFAPEASLEVLGLLQWGPDVEVLQLLGSWGPWQCHVHRGASSHWCRKYGASSFFSSLWHLASKDLFIWSFSVAQGIRHLKGYPLLGLLASCWLLHVGKERLQWWLHPLCVTQQFCLTSMAGQLSFQGISPSTSSLMSPLTVSLQLTADLTLGLLSNPYSPAPSHCAFQGTRILSRVGRAAAKIVWFSLLSDCHRWAAALSNSLKCFSCVPNNCPDVGIWSLLQVPHPPGTCLVLITLLFSPSFLHPTVICVQLYIPFQWSKAPAHSQLVFCKIFFVLRCIADASMEREVHHTHLLLHHLVSPYFFLQEMCCLSHLGSSVYNAFVFFVCF